MQTLIKNGTIVNPQGRSKMDVLVEDGRIIALAPELRAPGAQVIQAKGCYVFPGFIDTHTHFDLDTGSAVTADDFVTAFNRRVFEAIMELENSDGGFSTAVLGEQFDPDEMGRLAKLAQARRNLSENGQSVLKAAVRTLQDEKNAVTKDDAPPEDSLERLLEKKRQKMHKSNG